MLKEIIKKFFNKKTTEKGDLSDFFMNSSSRDKKKIFIKAGRAANRDQKDLMESHQKHLRETSCGC